MKVNSWEAQCSICRGKVRPFSGHAKHNGRRWLVQHINCSEAYRGRAHGRYNPT